MPDMNLPAPDPAAVDAAAVDASAPIGASPLENLDWKRVSPKYLAVEMIGTALFGLIASGVLTFLWLVAHQQWAVWVLAAIAVITIVNLVLEPRRVRAIGYLLRADDLLFRRGLMFQRIVAVPYGRMQLIDINRGPLARALGLADLKFVTAAASTGVAIPGLTEVDATALRDRLSELAESRRAGL